MENREEDSVRKGVALQKIQTENQKITPTKETLNRSNSFPETKEGIEDKRGMLQSRKENPGTSGWSKTSKPIKIYINGSREMRQTTNAQSEVNGQKKKIVKLQIITNK